MQELNRSVLSLISGGNAEYHRIPSIALASIAQVSIKVRDASSNIDALGDTVPHCNQYSHKAVAPKNGDYNAQGQHYSWGTWWDDMN
jgi:hypothetical protein